RMFWQAAADALPSLPEVGGLVDVRAAVIHKMEIYGDVGCSSIKTRRLDAGDGSPGRQAGDVPGDVLPFAASLRGEPHLAVISARPNQALLNLGRRSQSEDQGALGTGQRAQGVPERYRNCVTRGPNDIQIRQSKNCDSRVAPSQPVVPSDSGSFPPPHVAGVRHGRGNGVGNLDV